MDFRSSDATDADSSDVTGGHLSDFTQLPLEPQKALYHFFHSSYYYYFFHIVVVVVLHNTDFDV